MNNRYYICILLIVMVLSSSITVFAQTDETQAIISEKEVLILNGFQYGLPVADIYTKSIVDTLIASGIPVSNIYVEYLDLNRKDNETHRSIMQKMVLEKSINHSIELIIAIDQVAADFIVHECKDLFEGVPLIVSYDEEPVWEGPPRELIIAAASNDAERTVQYAFELFPNTQNVVFVMGKDDEKAPFIERLITAIEATDQHVTIERTNELSFSEMLERIAVLPPDTIAFYGSYFQDITNETFVPAAVANIVGKVANVPVFAFIDMHIKNDLTGGSVVIHEKFGQQVAQVALDYLSGTLLLTDKPIRVYPDFDPLFNWQQLKRWGADPGVLPSDTILLNYTPTLWESHKERILFIGLFFIVSIMLIVILIIRNRKQERTLEKLHESETARRESHDRLENIIKGTNVGTWEVNIQSGELEINGRWAEIAGYALEELIPCTIETWRQLVNPEDLTVAEAQLQQVFNGECEFYDTQFRMHHKKGNWVWILSRGKVITRSIDGKPLLMSGTHLDITEFKQLEEQIIESKKMFQSVVDTQQEMISRYLPDTTLTFVNDAYCRAFGKTRSELLGKKYLTFIPTELHEEELASLKRLHPAQTSDAREFDVTLSDGSIRWQEWTDIAIFNESGELLEIQGVGRDITRSKLAEENMLQAYDATIAGWAHALDLKDEETQDHSKRVTELTMRIAMKMGIKEEELTNVRRGALLHDIGKMGIPDKILLKPGKLTDEEWEIMFKHPVFAFEMLSSIDYLRPALDIPYCHHEKWDGSGYPRGLKGEQIPLAARIFAVVDVYDALTSNRPYRKAWTKEKTLEHIQEQSGSHFDPQLVNVFVKEMSG